MGKFKVGDVVLHITDIILIVDISERYYKIQYIDDSNTSDDLYHWFIDHQCSLYTDIFRV